MYSASCSSLFGLFSFSSQFFPFLTALVQLTTLRAFVVVVVGVDVTLVCSLQPHALSWGSLDLWLANLVKLVSGGMLLR